MLTIPPLNLINTTTKPHKITGTNNQRKNNPNAGNTFRPASDSQFVNFHDSCCTLAIVPAANASLVKNSNGKINTKTKIPYTMAGLFTMASANTPRCCVEPIGVTARFIAKLFGQIEIVQNMQAIISITQ